MFEDIHFRWHLLYARDSFVITDRYVRTEKDGLLNGPGTSGLHAQQLTQAELHLPSTRNGVHALLREGGMRLVPLSTCNWEHAGVTELQWQREARCAPGQASQTIHYDAGIYTSVACWCL